MSASSTPEAKWVSPIATPSYPSGGWYTIVSEAEIAASPVTCLEIVLNPSTYPSWNKWILPVIEAPSPPDSAASTPEKLRHLAHEENVAKHLLLGTEFIFNSDMSACPGSGPGGKASSNLQVTVLESFKTAEGRDGLRVAWKVRGDAWYLRAERVLEFVDKNGDGSVTQYNCHETFSGPASWAVKNVVGSKLVGGFGLWDGGLKMAAEQKTTGKTSS